MTVDELFSKLYDKYGSDFNWLITSSDYFVKELKNELYAKNCFDSISVIAKCESNDNVLFCVDGHYRIYHLTYNQNCNLPEYIEFENISAVIKFIEKDYIENYM